MHELSVTESMLGVVLRHAQANNATKVSRINMVLGDMSTVMEESVRFYFDIISKETIAEGAELNFTRFDIISKETIAEGAELNFTRTKLIGHCGVCGKEFEVVEFDFRCPECQGTETEIISGREFQVESIEIN